MSYFPRVCLIIELTIMFHSVFDEIRLYIINGPCEQATGWQGMVQHVGTIAPTDKLQVVGGISATT